MSGFCPDDWHGTTETDLQQMAAGDDYWFWIETQGRAANPARATRQREYAIHDAAIAQAKFEGLTFHKLPDAEQSARMDAAEAKIDKLP